MTLTPAWRTRIAAACAAVIAVWVGSAVANQELGLPGLIVGALALLTLAVMQPLPIDTLLLGLVVFGYIVGNRGFAQLSLAGNIPLLPAEFVLLIGGSVLLFRSAHRRELPVRRDALNAAVVLWMVLSTVRLYADVRTYGLMAVRDYATVYYAAFFFLGQAAAADESGERFLRRCVLVGAGLLIVVYPLFIRFPDVFLGPLSFRGAPLIFFKGDLAGTFLAVGSILFYLRFETRHSRGSLALSLALAGGTIMTNNRASMLGLFAAAGLLLLARRWRFAAVQAAGGVAAAVLILFVTYVRHGDWHQTPLYGLYERVVSLTDPTGQRTYSADTAADKGDNNEFRLVWWQTVVEDTVSTAPVVGLGYGYDLAERFLQEYYPDPAEEFTTRSPHNILLTVFARTGVIGLLPFLLVLGVAGARTVRTSRRELADAGLWLAAAAIFVSACFGVVLEGPMGAVVFWTALGVANAAYRRAGVAAGAADDATASPETTAGAAGVPAGG